MGLRTSTSESPCRDQIREGLLNSWISVWVNSNISEFSTALSSRTEENDLEAQTLVIAFWPSFPLEVPAVATGVSLFPDKELRGVRNTHSYSQVAYGYPSPSLPHLQLKPCDVVIEIAIISWVPTLCWPLCSDSFNILTAPGGKFF